MYILMQNNIKFKKNLHLYNDFTKNKNIIKKTVKSFVNDEYGQGLVEYGLLIVMIAMVLCVSIHNYCNKVRNFYTEMSSIIGPY